MATLRAAPTRHRHTEQFSGILPTNTYLKREEGRKGGREEGIGKNESTKWHANSKLF